MEMHESEQLIWRGHPSVRGRSGGTSKWGFLALLPVIIAGIFEANDQGTGIDYWKWVVLSLVLLVFVIVDRHVPPGRDRLRRDRTSASASVAACCRAGSSPR